MAENKTTEIQKCTEFVGRISLYNDIADLKYKRVEFNYIHQLSHSFRQAGHSERTNMLRGL
jgi:hypothetical protein